MQRIVFLALFLCLFLWPSATAAQNLPSDLPDAPDFQVEDESPFWVPPASPTDVFFDMVILDIPEINSRNHSFMVEGRMIVEWLDHRLAFDPAEVGADVKIYHDGHAEAMITEEIWSPIIEFENIRGARKAVNSSLSIGADGDVIYEEHFVATLSSHFDLHDFPFDRQEFEIVFTSFVYTADQMYFDPTSSVQFRPGFELDGWNIDHVPRAVITEMGAYGLEPDAGNGVDLLPHGEFIITLRREIGFYVWKLLIPILLITSISWVGFWRRPIEGNRIVMTFSCMLTIIAYNFVIGNSLPRIAYLTRLDRIFFLTYVFVALAIFQCAVAAYLGHSNRMEKALRLDYISRIAFPAVYITLYLGILLI